jgi:hypothetical protein
VRGNGASLWPSHTWTTVCAARVRGSKFSVIFSADARNTKTVNPLFGCTSIFLRGSEQLYGRHEVDIFVADVSAVFLANILVRHVPIHCAAKVFFWSFEEHHRRPKGKGRAECYSLRPCANKQTKVI